MVHRSCFQRKDDALSFAKLKCFIFNHVFPHKNYFKVILLWTMDSMQRLTFLERRRGGDWLLEILCKLWKIEHFIESVVQRHIRSHSLTKKLCRFKQSTREMVKLQVTARGLRVIDFTVNPAVCCSKCSAKTRYRPPSRHDTTGNHKEWTYDGQTKLGAICIHDDRQNVTNSNHFVSEWTWSKIKTSSN